MQIDYVVDQRNEKIGLESKVMDLDHRKKAKLFAILSTNLYKDAKAAIVRELCSNMYDANVMAGQPDRPFHITIPTYDRPVFIARDYAIGLTAEHAESTLFSYLGSDKDSSDDYIGGWGLGAKSPMAYATDYTVHLYKDGVHWEYLCSKGADGIPTHSMFAGPEPTEEPNGVEFQIPIRTEDIGAWRATISQYYANTNYPLTITNPEMLMEVRRSKEHYSFRHDQFHYSVTDHMPAQIHVRYGGALYPISELVGLEGDAYNFMRRWDSMSRYSLILNVDVGQIKFVPSRDSMESTPKTLSYVSRALENLIEMMRDGYQEYAESCILPIENLREQHQQAGTLPLLRDIIEVMNQIDPDYKSSFGFFDYIKYRDFANAFLDRSRDSKYIATDYITFAIDQPDREVTISYPDGSQKPRVGPLGQFIQRLSTSRCKSKTAQYRYTVHASSTKEHAGNVSAYATIQGQFHFLWSPNPISAASARSDSAISTTTFHAVSPDQESAVAFFVQAGFPEDEVRNVIESVENYGIEFVSRKPAKRRAPGTRTEIPQIVQCAWSGTRERYHDYYLYVHVTEEERRSGQFRHLSSHEDHVIGAALAVAARRVYADVPKVRRTYSGGGFQVHSFVASKPFLRRSADLSNVFHWREYLGPDDSILLHLHHRAVVAEQYAKMFSALNKIDGIDLNIYREEDRAASFIILRQLLRVSNAPQCMFRELKRVERIISQGYEFGVVGADNVWNFRRMAAQREDLYRPSCPGLEAAAQYVKWLVAESPLVSVVKWDTFSKLSESAQNQIIDILSRELSK